MSKVARRFYLTYPKDQVREPLLCQMFARTGVEFNLRTASVNQDVGIIGLELSGDAAAIEKAVAFFRERGVSVEPISLDVVEG